MEDKQIINLYFSRTEQAIKETKNKYSPFLIEKKNLYMIAIYMTGLSIPMQ